MSASAPFILKQFSIRQHHATFKVCTDSVILGSWVKPDTLHPILDIGTGTGILALMMAQRTQSIITAIEIDPLSAKDAAYNFGQSPWSARIQLISEDVRDWAIRQTGKYGTIICNPPYFSNTLKNSNFRKSRARHNDYLTNTELIMVAKQLLLPDGLLAIILPVEQMKKFIDDASIFQLHPQRICYIQHMASKEPKRCMATFSQIKQKSNIDNLILSNPDNSPTLSYTQLTADFYL